MNDTISNASTHSVGLPVAAESSAPRRDQAESSVGGMNGQQRITGMDLLFHRAAEDGHATTLQIHAIGPLSQLQTVGGNNVLHLHVTADFAEKPADVGFIETILDDDESLLFARNDREESPLHIAAKFGQHEAMKIMLDKGGADYRLLKNIEGDTALHVAVRNGCPKVVDELLAVGEPDDIYGANDDDETPLRLAILGGSEAMISLICNKIPSPQHGKESRRSTLHDAVMSQNSGLVLKMMELNSDLLTSKDAEGQSPLHYAVGTKANDQLLLLLLNRNASLAVYLKDNVGRTVAHVASQRNNVVGLKHLVNHFPDCCEIVDDKKRNAVHYASYHGRGRAMKYFFEHSRFKNLVDCKDEDGNTPLHLLACSLKELPLASVRYIKRHLIPILKKRKMLNVRINKKGLTAGDIAHLLDISQLEPDHQDLVIEFMNVVPEGKRYKNRVNPLSCTNTIAKAKEDFAPKLKKTAKDHSIIAGLFFTVAFAVFFAVPGFQSSPLYGGAAMRAKQPAFQALLISDTVAVTSSAIALLLYYVITLGNGKGVAKALFTCAFIGTSISMAALMIVFMAVTYMVAGESQWLVILMLVIASAFTFCYALFVIGAFVFIRRRSKLISCDYP